MTDTSRAPRVTTKQVEAQISSEHYFTAAQAVAVIDGIEPPDALNLVTICVLVLRNGFTIVGKSACASPEIFDAQIGRNVAREDAIDQVWPLLGYALKQELHKTQEAFNHGYKSPDR